MKLLVSRSAFWVGLAWLKSASRLAAQTGVNVPLATPPRTVRPVHAKMTVQLTQKGVLFAQAVAPIALPKILDQDGYSASRFETHHAEIERLLAFAIRHEIDR